MFSAVGTVPRRQTVVTTRHLACVRTSAAGSDPSGAAAAAAAVCSVRPAAATTTTTTKTTAGGGGGGGGELRLAPAEMTSEPRRRRPAMAVAARALTLLRLASVAALLLSGPPDARAAGPSRCDRPELRPCLCGKTTYDRQELYAVNCTDTGFSSDQSLRALASLPNETEVSVPRRFSTPFDLRRTHAHRSPVPCPAGAHIHRQPSVRAAVQRVRLQRQRPGETAVPRHVQQRHTRDQRQELPSRVVRRTSDTQQQQDRVERHRIPSS